MKPTLSAARNTPAEDRNMFSKMAFHFTLTVCFVASSSGVANEQDSKQKQIQSPLSTESLEGEGVWVSPIRQGNANPARPIRVNVWFDRQFLGDGKAYMRRAKEFSKIGRRELRTRVVKTLKHESARSYAKAKDSIQKLIDDKTIRNFQLHWIVNGFSCASTVEGLEKLKKVPGARKIFVSVGRRNVRQNQRPGGKVEPLPEFKKVEFDPKKYKHPWYIRSLLADRVWTEFGIDGSGTLNVIHDFNFVYPQHLANNVYRNPKEVAGNGKDDDGNGKIDDCYGYNFATNSARLTMVPNAANPQALHGTMCANIVCGTGTEESPYEFGIAPRSKWAGVIAGTNIESAVEWAIEQQTDTYSMSFSRPNMGELRSHWRKVMEHGSFCGVYFVSGAGNFAQTVKVPKQMRIPEDIPNVVFAAAGVQRDLSRTVFSSKGPVEWKTEHYKDGTVQKPEVCAFNHGLPLLLPNGQVRPVAINGNSFAGPMFCGSIALMLSADPDLLPWELKEIITSTATDISKKGVDFETGHGLINCYRAVKEVLRRKSIREKTDAAKFTGRSDGDEIDKTKLQKELSSRRLIVARMGARGTASKAGIKRGDVLLEVNGQKVNSAKELRAALKDQAKQSSKLVVSRAGKTMKFELAKGAAGVGIIATYSSPVFE